MIALALTIGIIWLALCLFAANRLATRKFHNHLINQRLTVIRR
jgi:hypothetical protein